MPKRSRPAVTPTVSLSRLPVDLNGLMPEVTSSLVRAERLIAALPSTPEALAVAKEAAEAAREATFPYLNGAHASTHAAAYAAASLLLAASLLIEAEASHSTESKLLQPTPTADVDQIAMSMIGPTLNILK